MTTLINATTVFAASVLDQDLAALLDDLESTPIPVEAVADEASEGEPDAGQPEEAVVVPAAEIETVEHVAGDLKEMADAVSEEDRLEMQESVRSEFERRALYELHKNPDNDKMAANLGAYNKKMSTLPLCAILKATDIDPGFINREISKGKRFNVYSIDKVNDLLMALETGHMKNAINRAVMSSLFAFRAAGVPFTGLMAAAAASDKIKVEAAQHKLLVRYTVSANTAPTQSSSTMNALATLGVVTNKGTQNFPVWQLTDTPQTRALEEALAA